MQSDRRFSTQCYHQAMVLFLLPAAFGFMQGDVIGQVTIG